MLLVTGESFQCFFSSCRSYMYVFTSLLFFLQCTISSLLTHTSMYKKQERLLDKIEKHRSQFSTLSLLIFSAEVRLIQDLELCNCIFLKTCKWTLIRLTLNNKIECTSSEQIKLHQGIKSISKNSACDEGIQTVFQCLVIALCNSGVSHRPTKQVPTVHKQCLVIALCNSGYHIYPPNKC